MTRNHLHATCKLASGRIGRLLIGSLLLWWLTEAAVRCDEPDVFDFTSAQSLLADRCGDCHGDADGEGGFSISKIKESDSLVSQSELWHRIWQRLAERSMPPADSEPMAEDRRSELVDWLRAAKLAAISVDGQQAGPPQLRRMARHEYANTVRDLLEIHFDAGYALPEDAAGGEGFNNAAETLTISPIHAEKYLQAALGSLDYAGKDETARERLLADQPSETQTAQEAARSNLRRFSDRAFRRPITDVELDRYVNLFTDASQDGVSFNEGVMFAMRGVMISPSFLFISESAPAHTGEAVDVTPHELATRLSYFLWATMPDDELRAAADDGSLSNIDTLRKQTLRMLGGRQTHLRDSMVQFVGQWLGTADLGRAKTIDRQKYPWMTDPFVAALRNQPVYVFESILRENDSVLDLIEADWTFMNNELGRIYSIDQSKIEEKYVQRLVRVKLPEAYRNRGSLLAMGGVLAVSAYPRRSSPVLRGTWVLDKLFGVELPPPPADVPALDESQDVASEQTLRQRLNAHRANPRCASCHDRIDPIGFALENFDELGRWREQDDGGPIDSAAQLCDGSQMTGLDGLREHVMANRNLFVHHLTRKLLGYGLGRGLRESDLCTVETIVQRLTENEYRSHELILGIVESEPFRKKRITP